MKHGSLFSGIGGFDLAAARMGWENIFQVEIDPFCRRVLQKNFPDAQRFTDIKHFDGTDFAGEMDIISGGFPCQPFSVAGQRRGKTDDRALWGEMLRVVRTIRPTWVVGENVAGIISMELDTVLADLEGIGYTCQAFVVPACAVNALHRRDRVWIVAHAKGQQDFGQGGSRISTQSPQDCKRAAAHPDRERQQQPQRLVSEVGRRPEHSNAGANSNPDCTRCQELDVPAIAERPRFNSGLSSFGTVEWQPHDTSDLLRAAYGIPGRVDSRAARIKALGNAIVPQVAFNIFQAIQSTAP